MIKETLPSITAFQLTMLLGILTWAAGSIAAAKLWLKREKWQHALCIFLFLFAMMRITATWMADIQTLLFPVDGPLLLQMSASSTMRLYGPIFLLPLIMFLVFYPLGLRVTERLDVYTLPFFVMVCASKIACHAAGCCYGIPYAWGIERSVSPFSGLHFPGRSVTVFPVQLFEAGTIALLVICMFFYRNSKRFKRGTLYPLTALFYAITRFGWEFFRNYDATEQNQTNLLLGLNFWQLVSVAAIVLSIVWLILVPKQMRRVEVEEQRGPEVSVFQWRLYRERWKLGFRNPGVAVFGVEGAEATKDEQG